jgi:hypothetical protein
MKAHAAVPFVDTNVVPDRNAGIGSLLWDLQNPRDADRDEPPLLKPAFAFIDVGVSRAKVATALKTLLAGDFGMDVQYVATERPEAVPLAHITPLGDRADTIRARLSAMISSRGAARQVKDWHCVVDRQGKLSSVAYSYDLHGNEVWESYFMGRPFMYSGERVEFADPSLDEQLDPEVFRIETWVGLERNANIDLARTTAAANGYRVEKNPLEAGLAESGIALQQTDVPQRVPGRQNVLFLANVLSHYPEDEQAAEFARITADMEAGDLVIVQTDGTETPTIDVLHVNGRGNEKACERVRWINTKTLDVQASVRGSSTWQRTCLAPGVAYTVRRVIDGLGTRVNSPEWGHDDHKVLVRQRISHVLKTFFRAVPAEQTLRIAIREAVRRVPSEGGPTGIPVFDGDATDAYGGALGPDPTPIVSEADLIDLGLAWHVVDTESASLTPRG